jgi:hypothetical protein
VKALPQLGRIEVFHFTGRPQGVRMMTGVDNIDTSVELG